MEVPEDESINRRSLDSPGGDAASSYDRIRDRNVLPEMTAHLSPGWLQGEGLEGPSVEVLGQQLEVSRSARENGETGVRLSRGSTGKRVSIVGGGPAGVAATVRLLEFGHDVEIFEQSDQLGGTPQRVISGSRAPDFRPEIGAILEPARLTGRLRLNFGRSFGEDLGFDEVRSGSDAVLLAVGVWQERSLGKAGGAIPGLEFLESVKRGRMESVPNRVALLTGGDSAMDAAVEIQQLGAHRIFIVFAGPRSEMHWHMSEEWFQTPGVETRFLCQPLGYEADESGVLIGLRFRNRESGIEELLPVDLVIETMGLEVADPVRAALRDLPQDVAGRIKVTETFRTRMEGVYAAGGLVNGGASVGQCVEEGMKAAEAIHSDLSS